MSTIKGAALISYDIPHSHAAVKSMMKDKGYYEHAYYSPKTYQLPNTTLWRPDTSSDQAMQDLQETCRSLNVTLEKAVSVLSAEWVLYNK